jgi:MFS family permease
MTMTMAEATTVDPGVIVLPGVTGADIVVLPDREISVVEAGAAGALGSTFWSVWSAATVSSLGDGLALVGFPLMAVAVTRRPVLVAGVVFAQRLPWLLCALPMGALADRFRRFRVMALVDLVRFVVVGAIGVAALSGRVGLPLLYAAAFTLGTLETLFSAAAHGALPAAVRPEQLDRANGYLFASQTAGEQLAGPAAGGVLYAAGAAVPFLGDAVSFAASAALLLRPARRQAAAAPQGDPVPRAGRARRRLRAEMGDGLRTFWRHPVLRVLSVTIGGMALCQSMIMGILVLYGIEVLHLSHVGYGLFLAAGATGNVLGALAASRLRARVGTSFIILFGGCLAAFAYVGAGATSSPLVAAALFAVEAWAVACGTVASMSLRQRCVAPELLGRVGNIYRMVIWGIIPIGTLIGGVLAANLGLRASFYIAGAIQLAVLVAVGGRLSRVVARLECPGAHFRRPRQRVAPPG